MRAPERIRRHAPCEWIYQVMMMFELLLVVSSVGLSVVLSRLAVGEMFRLVRMDRVPAPVPSRDDAR